jgi:DNA-binding GntR family transcriptional regulator
VSPFSVLAEPLNSQAPNAAMANGELLGDGAGRHDETRSQLGLPTRAESVTAQLKNMILSGDLAPGARLRQSELARALAVSTTPVREALTVLEREGFVRRDPHRGAQVFRATVKQIRENYEIRLALEPLAASLAAPLIGDQQLAEVERIMQEMERPAQLRLGTELNRQFHFAIYRAADRPQLLELVERLRRSADAYLQLVVGHAPTEYHEAVLREHREIHESLRIHSARAARRATRQHLQHNLAKISDLLKTRESAGD